MLQLPFKIEPQVELVEIGDKSTGVLEIPRLRDFTPAERIFISENTGMSSRKAVINFAAKMAKRMDKTITEVYQFAVNYLQSDVASEIENHLEAFADFQAEWEQLVVKSEFVKAVAVLRRVCPEATVKNSGDLHPGLLKKLTEFAIKEESGWDEELIESPEPTEEELGKSQAQKKKSQTGKKSSGE